MRSVIPKLRQIPGVKEQLNLQNKVFLTCPMAKFTKLSFSLSESHAKELFELVHIDIWGPYKVCTKGKFRFFLTIVDDSSRNTWVYLLQHKSDSLKTLEEFLHCIENRFHKSIKFLRSGNALEFDTYACHQFFASHGILHQTSCVERPQQNARVERKHKHILEQG